MSGLTFDVRGRTIRLKAHKCALDGATVPNSLSALRACIAADVAEMEIDASVLADDEFLVVHGPELADETTGHGAVSSITAAEARELRLVVDRRAVEERPPLLSEALAELRGTGRLQIDLKDEDPLAPRRLDQLARQLKQYRDQIVVGSGCVESLLGLRERLPGLTIGFDPLLLIDLRHDRYAGPLAPPGARAHIPAYLARGAFEEMHDRIPGASIWYLRASLIVRLAADGFDAIRWLADHGVHEIDAWTIDLPPSGPRRDESLRLFQMAVEMGATQVTTNTPLAWLSAPELRD